MIIIIMSLHVLTFTTKSSNKKIHASILLIQATKQGQFVILSLIQDTNILSCTADLGQTVVNRRN